MQNTAYKPSGSSGGKKWYYMSGGKRCGPIDAAQLTSMISAGTLPQTTRVWTQGMSNWVSATETPLVAYSGPVLAPAADAPEVVEQPVAKRKPRWWIWLITGLAVVAIAVACYFIFFADRGEDTPGDTDITETPVPVYNLESTVVFENDQCAFIIDAIGEKGDYLELDVRCVNKTDDVLSFCWDSTCINGSMFDPMWQVYVQGNSTLKSSVTFPLSTLKTLNLLPADQIKFVLNVFDEEQYNLLSNESGQYIIHDSFPVDDVLAYYIEVDGYENYLFKKGIILDKNGLPYYVVDNVVNLYFEKTGWPYCVVNDSGKVYFDEDGHCYCVTGDGVPVYFDRNSLPYYVINDEVILRSDENGLPYCQLDYWLDVQYDENGRPYYVIDEDMHYGPDGRPIYTGGRTDVYFDEIYDHICGSRKNFIIDGVDSAEKIPAGYKKIEGFEKYLFRNDVAVDKDGRPYYALEDEAKLYFDEVYNWLPGETGTCIIDNVAPTEEIPDGYMMIDGYEKYLFRQDVSIDAYGRPCYIVSDDIIVYFDEIYDWIPGQSGAYVIDYADPKQEIPEGYVKVKGFEKHLFKQGVMVDGDGLPYYMLDDNIIVHFDKNVQPSCMIYYQLTVHFDENGRSYYVTDDGENVYFDTLYKWFSDETGKYFNGTETTAQNHTWIDGYKKHLLDQGIVVDTLGRLCYVNDTGVNVYFNEMPDQLADRIAQHVIYHSTPTDKVPSGYMKVEGYDNFLFEKGVVIDENGRPYYVSNEGVNVYFDELYDRNGQPLYAADSDSFDYFSFYNDEFGRPYYFNERADTIYYEGYGFAFYDEKSGKYYFYDENGNPTYYGNGGVPEPYEGEAPQSLPDAQLPHSLAKAGGCHVVHKEFSLYPTGKTAAEVTRPDRITASGERIYWDGEKGSLIVLGGEMDEFKGYIVRIYIENSSDSYIYLSLYDAVINGIYMNANYITVLRPHSSAYRDVIIPASWLTGNKIKSVEEISCSIYAAGTNLSVPLYPIEWDAPTTADHKK